MNRQWQVYVTRSQMASFILTEDECDGIDPNIIAAEWAQDLCHYDYDTEDLEVQLVEFENA